jgi:hypothetical protein
MDKRVVLLTTLACLVAACALGLWWLATAASVQPTSDDQSSPGLAATATEASAAGGDADVAAAVSPSRPARSAAAAASASMLPFPDGAQWLPIRIVDARDGEPVADANVGWIGETIESFFAQQNEFDPDAMLLWRSLDLQVERAGWRTTSDGNGIARVTLGRWTTVIAAHDGRFGTLQIHEDTVAPPAGYVLELQPDHECTVQVVDDAGDAVADVLVAVGRYEQDRLVSFWRGGPAARTSAPDGKAVIQHLQELAQEEQTDGWRVRTYLPGFDDPGVPISLASPPSAPIVLRLPACGRVRAQATVGGSAMPGFTGAMLTAFELRGKGYRPQQAQWLRPVDADGWVRFPHVPLGGEYTVATHTSGRLSTRFVGPSARGQEIVVTIAPARETILLAGRIVDDERRPVGDRDFQVEALGVKFRTYSTFRTGADGRFVVALGNARDDNAVDVLRFDSHRHREPPQRVELPPRVLRPGLEDLGDLTIDRGKLVVAGRFVDEHGPCQREVAFWLQRYVPNADGDETWQNVRDVLEYQDEAGNFELRGTVAPGRLRLVFGSHAALPTPPVEFVVGTTDLEIRLSSGHRLAATVLLPKDATENCLFANLLPSTTPPLAPGTAPDLDRYRAEPWTDDGVRMYLQWPALPAGTYTLALHLWSHAEPVVRIADVQVPGPTGGDPRLAEIDLRRQLRTVQLDLCDASGRPLDAVQGIAFPTRLDPAGVWEGTTLHEATTRVTVPALGTSELLVAVAGHRPRTVVLSGDRVEVRLDAWQRLELHLRDVPTLPPEVRLVAWLEPTQPSAGTFRSRWSTGDRSDWFDAPTRNVPVVGGRASLPIGDGPHRVVLRLLARHRLIEITGVTPAVVLPTSEQLQVQVAAAHWAEALATVQAQSTEQEPRRPQ